VTQPRKFLCHRTPQASRDTSDNYHFAVRLHNLLTTATATLSQLGARPSCLIHKSALTLQPQRGCDSKPRVGPSADLPWVHERGVVQPQRGCGPNDLHPPSVQRFATPSGLVDHLIRLLTQGSSCLATLGFRSQPLWGRKCRFVYIIAIAFPVSRFAGLKFACLSPSPRPFPTRRGRIDVRPHKTGAFDLSRWARLPPPSQPAPGVHDGPDLA
jgi:hypothetical protein